MRARKGPRPGLPSTSSSSGTRAGEEGAAAGIAEHILKFWDPRMRAGICGHLRDGGAGLDAPVRRAVAALCGRIGPDGRLHPG